ncbi:competence type IV pilus minor pilin ComGF [Bacillus suaedae]|uniref:ComGF family competence protein n=1 Tax=Halalkalibacter suaedae TaxID=2822140 RepID=A0A940WXC4_9BACI|nr:competence type IV pilus minor pilin ComGF [Bacillus suaedae]MBP3952342.1 ComGF family competence protein [Bacillus suaedae]
MKNACLQLDRKAFTLIELLIVLSILLLILSILPPMIQTVATGLQTGSTSPRELTVFFSHLSDEVRESSFIDLRPGKLILHKADGDRITIELYSSTKIRRTVNGAGHVLMLEGVKTFYCDNEDILIQCEVIMQDGLTYRKSLIPLYKSR